MGIAKQEWGLSPRADYKGQNDGASRQGPWEDAPEKEWQARRMAVYAAMVESMDRGIGRILDAAQDPRRRRNTLVLFLSDNGGCAENVHARLVRRPQPHARTAGRSTSATTRKLMPGPEEVYQSYGPAWANASNTPFRRFKHWTEEGGISTPFIARWPRRDQTGRADRAQQVGDVIDLMPTVLELAGATYPKQRNGHEILPPEGRSLVPPERAGRWNAARSSGSTRATAPSAGRLENRRRARREVAPLQPR